MSVELLIALAALSEAQREAFIDRHLVGRSYKEIAATMGCSVQNVSNLIRRARVKLAASLDEVPA